MSIQALTAALNGRHDVCLVVVSPELFFQLDSKNHVGVVQVTPELPGALVGSGSVRHFLRSFMVKTGRSATFTHFVMDLERQVRVEFDTVWNLKLAAEGPDSFILVAMVTASAESIEGA